MNFDFNTIELELAEAIQAVSADMGISSFFVGGFVRDKILNRASKDIDVVY